MIKNIVFDFGKVLADWDPTEALKANGADEEKIRPLMKKLSQSGLWDESDRGTKSKEELLEMAIEIAPECEKEIRIYWECFSDTIVRYDYTEKLLRACRDAGYGVYVLSNFGDWTYRECEEKGAFDFLPLVDGSLFSYELKLIKPEREIYQALCERFSLVPEECVFLDDMERNIDGAIDFGMQGIVFTGIEDAMQELEKIGVSLSL